MNSIRTTLCLCLAAALTMAQAPSNDECVSAIPVTNGQTIATNVGATNSVGFAGSCIPGESDVFFSYLATAPGLVHASLCQTPGNPSDINDSVINVYSGGCAGAEVSCNDDNCGLLSSTSFNAVAGTTYIIRVAGYSFFDTGTFILDVQPAGPPPANDTCLNATIVGDGTVNGDNTNATTEPGLPLEQCGFNPTNDVWYQYYNTSNCYWNVTASLCPTTAPAIDSMLRVFTGTCGNFTEIACNDDFCGLISETSFILGPGQSAFIAVAIYNDSGGGPFGLTLSHGTAVAQPVGASCPIGGPSLSSDAPILGGTVTITVANGTPGAAGTMFYGVGAPSPFVFLGCSVYIDLATLQPLLNYVTDAGGGFQLVAPLPNIPALDCVRVMLQSAHFGTLTPNGFELTNGLDAQLGY